MVVLVADAAEPVGHVLMTARRGIILGWSNETLAVDSLDGFGRLLFNETGDARFVFRQCLGSNLEICL